MTQVEELPGELYDIPDGIQEIEFTFTDNVYSILDGKMIENTYPSGMSGSPLWRFGHPSGLVWSFVNLQVIGVVSDFHELTRKCYAVPAVRLFELLAKHFVSAKNYLENQR